MWVVLIFLVVHTDQIVGNINSFWVMKQKNIRHGYKAIFGFELKWNKEKRLIRTDRHSVKNKSRGESKNLYIFEFFK